MPWGLKSSVPDPDAMGSNLNQFELGLNIFIDIQTSKTLIQMDINKMMRMEFIQ